MTLRVEPDLVSIVIPVFNGADTLPVQLAALERQTYQGRWELLIVDNGSTDGTAGVVASWSDRLPLRVVDASEAKGVAIARNRGFEEATGDLLAFCDCDDEAAPDWLESLVAASARFDQVAGPLETTQLNGDIERSWRSRSREAHRLPTHAGFLPYATGCNFAVWSDVARSLGGWNPNYRFGGDDVEFSFRLQLAGYSVGFADGAVMHYRLRSSVWSMARQTFQYSLASVLVYRDFKSAGLASRSLGSAVRQWIWLGLRVAWIVGGRAKRGVWARHLAGHVGRLAGSLKYRVWYP